MTEEPSTGTTGLMSNRTRWTLELLLVFGLSLGKSGVYAVVQLGANLTSGIPLSAITTTINGPRAPATRPTLDLIYQLLAIGFALVPVALACYFIAIGGERVKKVLGIDASRPGWDLGVGALLAALIGGSGLALYFVARAMGFNVNVVTTSLYPSWWRIPVLILLAFENAILEETLVVGFLLHRLQQLGWRPWPAAVLSSLIRGSYHLYQGFGAFLGNAVMGLIFARVYQRWGRTAPLIIAHGLIDSVAFVGYVLLAGHVSWLPS